MAYEDMIRNYSDPDRFKRQGKAQAIGAALAALLSGVAKKNLVPGYMSGVERVQEQQQQQRMMERMQMQDMMAVKQHEADMRQMDLINKQREMQMAQAEKQMAAQQKYAEFVTKNEREERMQSIKEGKERLGGITDFVGKMSQIAGQVSPSLGKAGEAVTGRMKESVGKVEQKAKAGVEADIGQMRDILSVAPELAPQMGIEPILGKRAQKQYESDTAYDALRLENAQMQNEINQRTLDTDPNYKANVERYAAEIQAGVTKPEQVPQDYRSHAEALAVLGKRAFDLQRQRAYGTGSRKTAQDATTAEAWNKATNATKEAIVYEVRAAFQAQDEQGIRNWAQQQLAKGVSKDLVETKIGYALSMRGEPVEQTYTVAQAAPSLVQTGMLVDAEGEPVTDPRYYFDATPESIANAARAFNLEQTIGGFKEINYTYRAYKANPLGYVDELLKGEQSPQSPSPEYNLKEMEPDIKRMIKEGLTPNPAQMAILNSLGFETWEEVVEKYSEKPKSKKAVKLPSQTQAEMFTRGQN